MASPLFIMPILNCDAFIVNILTMRVIKSKTNLSILLKHITIGCWCVNS